MQQVRYDHDSFKPVINGDDKDALTRPAPKDGVVRILLIPRTHFDRDLLNAVWAWSRHAEGGKITRRLALCIMHCAMRTLESSLRHLLQLAADRFESGSAADKRVVTTPHRPCVTDSISALALLVVGHANRSCG